MSGKELKAYLIDKGFFLPAILTGLVYNAYFIWLLPHIELQYLVYLDILVLTGLLAGSVYGFWNFRKRQSRSEAAEEETALLREELKRQFDMNCDLQDYIAKWCHEVKIPLSAAILMTEKMEDGRDRSAQGQPEDGRDRNAQGQAEEVGVKQALQEQLERIRQLLANALLGCKIQSSLFDLQIRPVSLAECVRASLHNNQFFLVQKHFEPDIRVGEEKVYTDKAWLVYILDQLISNAVKYVGDRAVLTICGDASHLVVEDRGVGIREEELRSIFEKGFTGSNYHNGQYKSTGMGLYMAKKIAEKLGHGLTVESVYGEYTRFTITFADNREHFLQET